MPHRTTYFFPRQFPERRPNESSSKSVADHDKKSGKSEDVQRGKVALESFTSESISAREHTDSNSFVTGHKIHGQHLSAEKRKEKSRAGHLEPEKIRLCNNEDCIEEEDLVNQPLLTLPPPAPDGDQRRSGSDFSGVDHERRFERKNSLQRLSCERSTSYAGSLFSGTTLDGTWSPVTTGVLKDGPTAEGGGPGQNVGSGDAKRQMEGYHLKIMLARRLTQQASTAGEPLLQKHEIGGPPDPETVSYRLWV